MPPQDQDLTVEPIEETELLAKGSHGEIPVTLYRAAGPPGTRPALVYLHGGGFRMGSRRSTEHSMRLLAQYSSAAVFSVEYRLAPEHRFPCATDDAWNALRWVYRHAAELDVCLLYTSHIPFDTVILSALEDFASRLNDYDVIVLPDLPRAPGPKLRQALLATTASVIGTGHTLHEDPQLLEQLFGVRIREKIEPVAASYLLTEPKEVFRSVPARDWVFLHMDLSLIHIFCAVT